jgi:hypothetical protein
VVGRRMAGEGHKELEPRECGITKATLGENFKRKEWPKSQRDRAVSRDKK